MQASPVIRSICLPTKFQCLYLPTSNVTLSTRHYSGRLQNGIMLWY